MKKALFPATAVALAAAAAVAQQGFEKPGAFKASALLEPAQVKGAHFKVAEEVPLEGFYYAFSIGTDFGTMEADGMSLLRTRLTEVEALAKLQDVSRSDVFIGAAGRSLQSLGKGAVSAVKDPGATARGIGKGIKRFGVNLGRTSKKVAGDVGDTVSGNDKDQKKEGDKTEAVETVANAAFGVNKSARVWAQKLHVDPYTTNPVLGKALLEVGKLDAAAGIATKIIVPVPTVVSMTSSVGNLVWGKDPQELLKMNESRLAELGVSADVEKAFFKNAAFTLTHQTRFIAALHAVKAKGVADYVDAARGSKTEREALFFVEGAEMLQALHAAAPVSAVLTDSRAMVAKTQDGKGVALLPLDYAAWTANVQKAGTEIAERTKKELGAKTLEMRMTGRASVRAKKELGALGWTLQEGVALPGSGGR